MNQELYVDFNGSTPVDAEVARSYVAWLADGYGNASAAHAQGLRAHAAIEGARATIARGLGAAANEIWFTSGGTESNNWALLGSAPALRSASRGHLIVSAIEHKSVLATAAQLERDGCALTVLPVQSSGAVDVRQLERALRPDTFLVAVMLANNETGVLQPAREIGALCRARGIRYHCDAVCVIGKLPVDVRELGCDTLSLSSHKLYAPKGVGLLYVHSGVELRPLIHGCGQQCGMRSGTENTGGAIAFATAFERLEAGAFAAAGKADLVECLWRGLSARFPRVARNGEGACLPNTLSVAFADCLGVDLQSALAERGVSVAAGAAASNGAPSHVLIAMGCSEQRARSTLRFSLGATSTAETVERLLGELETAVARCARPLATAAREAH